jgi:hypothetical protein
MKTLLFNLPFILGLLVPFIIILRGMSLLWGFFLCWGGLVLSYFIFTLIAPLAVGAIDRDVARAVCNIFPEPTFIVGMLAFGWFYAGMTVFVAWVIRRLLVIFR